MTKETRAWFNGFITGATAITILQTAIMEWRRQQWLQKNLAAEVRLWRETMSAESADSPSTDPRLGHGGSIHGHATHQASKRSHGKSG